MKTGHAPTTIEMLRMLTSITSLLIRGGYYDGHEETWLDNVIMLEGDHVEDALLRKVEKHARHPMHRRGEEGHFHGPEPTAAPSDSPVEPPHPPPPSPPPSAAPPPTVPAETPAPLASAPDSEAAKDGVSLKDAFQANGGALVTLF